MSPIKELLLICLLVACVNAKCDKAPVKQVEAIFKGTPPEKVMEELVGKNTYVYMSPSLQNQIPGHWNDGNAGNIGCLQSVVDTDRASVTDYLTFINKTKHQEEYGMVLEWPGKLAVLQYNGFTDEFIYILYSNVDVWAYYRCDSSVDEATEGKPGVAILVHNYDAKSQDQAKRIASAKAELTKLKYTDGVDLKTDCQ